jgi:hypothetical protein
MQGRTILAMAVVIIIASGTLAACTSTDRDAEDPTLYAPITVPLKAVDSSGVTGTAAITKNESEKTNVVMNITGQTAGTTISGTVNSGTCDLLDVARYSLNTVNGSTSTSVINTGMPDLLGEPFAVVVLDSTGKQLACGNIIGAKPTNTMEVTITSLGNSGESGGGTIAKTGGKTRVTLTIVGEPVGVSQTAGIYAGTCAAPSLEKWTVNPVVNGSSNTILGAAFAQLTGGQYVLVLQDGGKTVACGPMKM